jgi:hypothetical protein
MHIHTNTLFFIVMIDDGDVVRSEVFCLRCWERLRAEFCR